MYRAPIDIVAMLFESNTGAPETEQDVLRRAHGDRVAQERARSREADLARRSSGPANSRRASALWALVGLRRDPSRGH